MGKITANLSIELKPDNLKQQGKQTFRYSTITKQKMRCKIEHLQATQQG